MEHHITIGTRGSKLALWQAEHVRGLLVNTYANLHIDFSIIKTTGDQLQSNSLINISKGLFTKEIEIALLNQQIDLAVHSIKDLPTDLPKGLKICCIPVREDPRDALVSRSKLELNNLPMGAKIGTSSLRRLVQVKELRPDLIVQPIRGNVGTRLQKVQGPDYDAVILAAAGLKRLGQLDVVSEFFDPSKFTSDVGQGTLVVQHRSADSQLGSSLASITHAATSAAFRAERKFLAAVGGGCSSPVAAYAHIDGDHIRMSAMAGLPDGSQVFRTTCEGNFSSPETAGQLLGNKLLSTGAKDFLGG